MTDQTATLLTTLRQRAAAGYLWLGLVADELERLQSEVDYLRGLNEGLIDRVAAQSELLTRRAESVQQPDNPIARWAICLDCGGSIPHNAASCNWCALLEVVNKPL